MSFGVFWCGLFISGMLINVLWCDLVLSNLVLFYSGLVRLEWVCFGVVWSFGVVWCDLYFFGANQCLMV